MAATLLVLLVVALMTSGGADATHLVTYSGNYYTGSSQIISKCGCTNIVYGGSYKYYAEGQSTRLYNMDDCQGTTQTVLSSTRNSGRPVGFGWNSAFILDVGRARNLHSWQGSTPMGW
ncbi:hypothetical protein Sjap_003202 [Stephania japonica]|uniref:Uncharacterized protein n=1 Tax=Stephania japonica TaxID=461633 RepID=A0AAP0PTC7_9MAGN